MFLSDHDPQEQTWFDANNVVQELFHLAHPKREVYTDEQLANALRNTPYVADEKKAFPDGTANIFDPRYNPGGPEAWPKSTAYSIYFHTIAKLHCGDPNLAGIGRHNGP